MNHKNINIIRNTFKFSSIYSISTIMKLSSGKSKTESGMKIWNLLYISLRIIFWLHFYQIRLSYDDSRHHMHNQIHYIDRSHRIHHSKFYHQSRLGSHSNVGNRPDMDGPVPLSLCSIRYLFEPLFCLFQARR